MNTITEYSQFVEKMAIDGRDTTFYNSGPIHAAIVMATIFRHAQQTVRIYCGGFDGAVSNDEEYLKQLENFLSREGTKIKILVEKNLTQSNSQIFKILKRYPDRVDARLTSGRRIFTQKEDGTIANIHFTVGDSKLLRVETGTTDYTAEVNFGNEAVAAEYCEVFDDLFNDRANLPLLAA